MPVPLGHSSTKLQASSGEREAREGSHGGYVARPAVTDENHFEISKDTTDCSVAANQPDNLPLSLFFLPKPNAIVARASLIE